MAANTGSGKTIESTRCSVDAEDKDRLITELNNKIHLLEKELQSKSDISSFANGNVDIQYLLGSFNLGIWAIDPDDNTVFLNRIMADSLKYTVEEMAGRNFFEFVYDESVENVKNFWQRVREGESLRQEIMLRCKDGTPYYAFVFAKAARDDQGRLTYSLGIFMEINERRQMLEAIGNSPEKYRMLIEDTNDLVWETDNHYVFTYLNPMMFNLIGYTAEESVGKKIIDFMPPEEARLATILFSFLEANKAPTFKVEGKYRHKDGHIVHLEISGRSIKDKDSNFLGCRGTARDVTKRKNAEIALEEAKSEAELYLDLMSHDINNLNHIALGYLEQANCMLQDEKIRPFIVKPFNAITSSSHLIKNVGKLQKAKEGGLKNDIMDLNEILVEQQAQYYRVPNKDVTINFTPCYPYKVVANGLIKDVFSNLIWNAIKHSNGASVEVNMDIKGQQEDGKQFCKVIVEDNGPGIPDTEKEQIFARFQRGNTKASGKGLGLYLVRTLVEGYNGKVWVEDRLPGDHTKGARFVVMLPAVDQ
jgi:PAS domain S-box-containing protein